MAKIERKTNFIFVGDKVESTQQQYDNLIEDTSYIYLKFQLYITNITQDFLDPEIREQHLNKLKLEEIKELETGLKHFKDKTITLMDTTAMILHKKYPKQPKDNQKTARAIKELLNQEQMQIKKQYTETEQQLH